MLNNRMAKIAVVFAFLISMLGPVSCASSSNTAAVTDTTPAYVSQIPPFDKNKDGPLLTEAKTVKLETNAGPITLHIDPSLAPVTATYMYKLFSGSAFIGTQIPRYEPNFVLQVGNIWDKGTGQSPMPDNAKALLRRIPLEVSTQKHNELNHHKHVLSMARYDGGPDSATGSFSILLGDAPHLDHQYTIFGKIGEDAATLETLAKMRRIGLPINIGLLEARKRVLNSNAASNGRMQSAPTKHYFGSFFLICSFIMSHQA